MSFTDDDLKRLKDRSQRHDFTTNSLMSRDHLFGLLARLEAAEACVHSVCKNKELRSRESMGFWEAWRTAAERTE